MLAEASISRDRAGDRIGLTRDMDLSTEFPSTQCNRMLEAFPGTGTDQAEDSQRLAAERQG